MEAIPESWLTFALTLSDCLVLLKDDVQCVLLFRSSAGKISSPLCSSSSASVSSFLFSSAVFSTGVSSSQASLLSAFGSSVVLDEGLLGEFGDFDELGVEGIFFAFLSGNEFRTSESG